MSHGVTTWRQMPRQEAAQLLQGSEGLDPRGLCTPEDVQAMCKAGRCGVIEDEDGAKAVIVTTTKNGVLWVNALKGQGRQDMTAAADRMLVSIAKAEGLRAVALQTKRPGLRRKLEKRGYRVTGWIMSKDTK